jgi:multiple sugar transport system permease protein
MTSAKAATAAIAMSNTKATQMLHRPFRWPHFLALVAGLLFALFPIFWMVSTSFKPVVEWTTTPPVWISGQATWDNYRPLLVQFEGVYRSGNGASWIAMMNSLIVSSAATLISLIIGGMAAIGFSRYRAGGHTMALAILSVRGIPTVVIAIPFLILFGWFGLRDTHVGLILAYVVFTAPFAFWMLKSFVDEIPAEIEEAAMMDGMSRWEAHIRVTLPLAKGGVIATGLFIFILNWSEFLLAMVLSEKTVITVPVNINFYGGAPGIQAALATVAALPIVIAGLLIHKHLARGFTLGAIKR